MKFNVARDAALGQLERFRSQGNLGASNKIDLIPEAVAGETRRLSDEFKSTKNADQKPELDLSDKKGYIHTLRGPTDKEWLDRTVETGSKIHGTPKKGEVETHRLATLAGEDEPYQETFELTKFQPDGISHVSVTIQGDGGVGCGGIISMAEFLSPEPGKSWRERSETNFLNQDTLALYQQGTYKPKI